MTGFTFHVPGTPEPLRRHRAGSRGGRVVTFDDPRNQPYQDRIRWAWRDAGGTQLGDELVDLQVISLFARPATHIRRDGSLSALGQRATNPSRSDVDNLAKNVMDALNGLAWTDDRQVVSLTSVKVWADPEMGARLIVTAGPA